jgi:hypothetical protein
MKYFIASFLCALNLTMSPLCQAGDRSTVKEKKTAKVSSSTNHHNVQQTGSVSAHSAGTAFCRRADQYCIRIAASPWWPNAPGD